MLLCGGNRKASPPYTDRDWGYSTSSTTPATVGEANPETTDSVNKVVGDKPKPILYSLPATPPLDIRQSLLDELELSDTDSDAADEPVQIFEGNILIAIRSTSH